MAFLDTPFGVAEEKTYSEATAQLIDAEIRAMMKAAEDRALALLNQKRSLLDAIAEELLEKETIDRQVLEALVQKHSDAPPVPNPPSSAP
jgi:cell division protease FtsH